VAVSYVSAITHRVSAFPKWVASFGLLTLIGLGFVNVALAQTNACDLNLDGTVNTSDVNLAVNMALGSQPCTASLTGAGTCNVITVQRVVNAGLGQPCVVDASYPTGLSAGYPFQEGTGSTVAEVTGTHSAGTISGASWTSSGKYGNALSFNGSTSYVNLGTFDVTGQVLTISVWIKADSFASNVDPRILSKATGTTEADHYFMLGSTPSNGNKLRFRLKTNGVTKTLIASSGDLPVGQWVHAAATYDGSMMKLYKDGVEVGSVAMSGSISSSNAVPVWIGRNPDGTNAFQGTIDELRIYSKALTPAEIQNDMNTPFSGTVIPTPQPPPPTQSTVRLTWVASVTPNVSYHLYRATSPGGPYTKLTSSPISATNYTDSTVESGKTYYYVATAVDTGNLESSYSNQASAVIP